MKKVKKGNNKKVNNKKIINKRRFDKNIIDKFVYISIPILCIALFLIILNRPEIPTYEIDENVVFFGDSITSKYNIDEFYPNTFVVNSGVSGDISEELLDRIKNDVYKFNPSKVILLIGINDMNHDVSENDYLNNVQNIINGIKTNRKNAKIYIESIYPINRNLLNKNNYKFNEKINNKRTKNLNIKLEELAKQNDVTYINVYDTLVDENNNLKEDYTIEGLHLNDLGYFKVTSILEKYVYE